MPISTLIAAGTFESGIISDACDRLANGGCAPAEIEWIEAGKAVDIGFEGSISDARRALAPFEGAADIVVQASESRRKMLLVSDMDSTMITVECIDELADYAGIKPEIAAITERAMAGELDFAEALKARVALLAGLDEDVIAQCLEERVRPMAGAEISGPDNGRLGRAYGFGVRRLYQFYRAGRSDNWIGRSSCECARNC